MQKPSLFDQNGRSRRDSNQNIRQDHIENLLYSQSSLDPSDSQIQSNLVISNQIQENYQSPNSSSRILKISDSEKNSLNQLIPSKEFNIRPITPNRITARAIQFSNQNKNHEKRICESNPLSKADSELLLTEQNILRRLSSIGVNNTESNQKSGSIKSNQPEPNKLLVHKLLPQQSGFDFSAIKFKAPKAKVISKQKIRQLMSVTHVPEESETFRNLEDTPDLFDTNHPTYNLWSRILNYDHCNQTNIDEQFDIKRSMLRIKKGISITHSHFNSKTIFQFSTYFYQYKIIQKFISNKL